MNKKIIKLGITGIIVYLLSIIPASAGANVSLNFSHNWSNPNWLELMLSPLTDLMGNMAYMAILMLLFGVLYIKSHHTIMLFVMGIFTAGVVISKIPVEFQGYIVFLIGLAFAVLVYRAFYRND